MTNDLKQQPSYTKWIILALCAATFAFVFAIPLMSVPVLFDEISADIDLSIVQIGWIWGSLSAMGIVVGLVGGPLGDRFGARSVLVVACIALALFGAARGLATSFITLLVAMLLTGFAQSALPMNVHKTSRVWFPRSQLGLATGIVSTGMALGFLLGAVLAANTFSPFFGGWRNLMFFYGGVTLLFAFFWWRSPEKETDSADTKQPPTDYLTTIKHVMSLRNVWLICIATAFFSGGVNGMLGFLPLYLRELGWTAAVADSTTASFHGASMLFTIPITLLSDRLANRRGFLVLTGIIMAVGIALIGFTAGLWVSAAVLLAGFTRDGFMSLSMASVMEVKGIGARYAGAATGLNISAISLVSIFAPPMGNALTRFGPGYPFLFWGLLTFIGLVPLMIWWQNEDNTD